MVPVDRGLRKPWILKETSVPPLMSVEDRLVTVRTEFEKEHYIVALREGEFDEQAMAPCKYSNCVVGDSGFHFGNVIVI